MRTGGGLFLLFFNTNLHGAQELCVLGGEPELAIGLLLRRQLLPVHQIGFAAFVETNCDFEHQKQIVARGSDSGQDFGDTIGLGE